ncbi:MAG TPA: protein kinase [Bryobacteraceae bacterium]
MTSEQWQVALRIYNAAREQSESERRAFVERESSDPEIAGEVLEMLEFATDPDAPPTPAPVAADRSGMRIGRYQIGRLIGRGGMGEVYEARDSDLDRPVAIKFLLPEAMGDRSAVVRLVREAKAASALNHPNILTVHEVLQSPSGLAMATELVEGQALRAFRATGVPLPKLMTWGRQIASALEAAHQEGIVHRDIKPENLMVREDGYVKVLDFGLAREFSETPRTVSRSSALGAAAGTPRYMSPEQLRGERLTGASDVFSLGIVLYEFATGRHPFEAAYAWETAHAINSRQPMPPVKLNPSIPPELQSLIQAMLAKKPESRPSAKEVAARLEGGVPAQRIGVAKRLLAAAAIVPVAAVLAWWGSNVLHPAPREMPLNLVPLTSFPGAKDFPAFSPDGTRIAFSWTGGQEGAVRHIYVKAIGASEAVQLSSAPSEDMWPAWSPDGRSIAYVRKTTATERAIYVAPSEGGSERQVWTGGDGVSWSPDGKWLALANTPPPKGSGGLVLLSLETGERRTLTTPQNASDGSPVFSRNGQWIGFMRLRADRDLFIVPARGGTPKQLTFDAKPKLSRLAWTADDREIVYSTEREFGGAGLWRISVSGGEPRRLTGILPFAGNPSISPKGDRLAFTESWLDTNIYQSDGPGFTTSGNPGRFGEPKAAIASSREDHSPSFSPDGTRIAFVSNRTSQSEIWTARRDGSGEMQLTHFNSFAGTPRWSPDGRWIVFDCLAGGNPDIWVISAEGGTPRRITAGPGQNTKPAWSPDGAWVYFASGRSGTDQIWKVTADGQSPTQLTWGGGREPLPSADGSTVYYTKRAGGAAIWRVPAGGGPERPLEGMENFNQVGRAWGVLAQGIYFVSREAGGRNDAIRFFSFATRHVIPLGVSQERSAWVGPVALSPDGRHLLTVHTDQQVNDLMLIENFR